MDFQEFIDKILPPMNEEEQAEMLKELAEKGNEDSRLMAIADPLAISKN